MPDNGSIDGISYTFSPGSLLGDNREPSGLGPQASLSVTRAGKVRYSFESRPGTGSGGKTVVKAWDVPPAEAAELLDALVADGLLHAESVPRFTAHHYKVWYGRWQLTSTPATMPPGVLTRLLPYVETAHPDWNDDAVR